MKTFINTFKLFFRIPSLFISYFLMLLVDNYLMYKILSSFIGAKNKGMVTDSMYFYGDMGILCFVLMIIPIFLGYEFLRKNNTNSFEVVSKISKGVNVIKANQILVLLLLLVLHVINIGVCLLIGFLKIGTENIFFDEIIEMYLCDFILLPFAALSIGILLSRIRNKYIGYSLIIFVCFTCLSTTDSILTDIYHKTSIPVYYISDFCNLIPPDITATYDPLYGFPMELYRVLAKVFWIVLAMWTEMIHLTKGRQKWKQYVCLAIGSIMIVLLGFRITNKGSVLRMQSYAKSGIVETNYYYGAEKDNQKEKRGEFYITNYDMELTFSDQLYAKVLIEINQHTTLKEYNFTLYHGYHVDYVENVNGEKLNFVRDGDYLTVKNEEGKQLEEIIIGYKGYSSVFYSNKKACFLPGLFPYYPKAGFVKIYEDGYVGCENEKSHFRIKTNGIVPYSNLPKEGNVFQGDAKNVILLSGFYEEKNIGVQNIVYYPMNGLSKEIAETMENTELRDDYKKLCNYLGVFQEDVFERKKIIIIPSSLTFNSVLKSFYVFDQYILLGDSTTAYDVLESQVPYDENKTYLRDVFFYFQAGMDVDFSEEALYSEDDTISDYEEYMEIHDLFITKAKKIGQKEVARKVFNYLADTTNTEKEIDFMRNLR
ncbi:MAG: hypothetical protein J6J27_02680 [Alphaproteobacteria bacterium]|nr:hypothetical protein [Alphaproteobacteria bacterium]